MQKVLESSSHAARRIYRADGMLNASMHRREEESE